MPLILAALLNPALARTGDRLATADMCRQAAEEASRQTGVPLAVLMALTLTETGRKQDGVLQPWPWALNQGGEGFWFPTRDEALAYLQQAVAQGVGNIDVGCFQLNYRWHGQAFASLEQMMDPRINALYAARLVAQHATEKGDWITAAGAYHSATPGKAKTYLDRFAPIYAALGGDADRPVATDMPVVAQSDEPRVNRFPLLMAGQAATAGSLVPQLPAGHSLFGEP
jgi:hypothetical protein